MWTLIQNKKEYEDALNRLEELSETPPDEKSDEGRELMLLGYLINHYEESVFPIIYPQPVEAIKARMEDLGLQKSDLLDAFGDRGTASKVLNKQRGLSLSMIRILSERLSLPLTVLVQPLSFKAKKSFEKQRVKAKEPKVRYKKTRKLK